MWMHRRPSTRPAWSMRSNRSLAAAALATVMLLGGCSLPGGAESDRAESDRADRPTPTAQVDNSGKVPGRSSDDPPNSPELQGIPADWTPAPLRWKECSLGSRGQCSALKVPLDWSDVEGRQITLVLGRIEATGDSIGSLLMNPGGPGGSGLEMLSWNPASDDLADRFDLVSWDPRGVGRSTSVDCDGDVAAMQAIDPDPDDRAEQDRLESAAAAVAQGCAADTDLLAHIGTADVARDMEAIRRALGDQPLNYLGFSYGTHIGQMYAAMYPTAIRAMTLDGVVDPALGFEDFLIDQAIAFERVFDDNARECSEVGVQECGVQDLAAAYDKVLAKVETSPLPGGQRPVGPAELATAAVQTGYGANGWRQLGFSLAEALGGDGTALWTLANSYYQAGGFASYAAVVCTDSPPPAGVEAYRAFAERARSAAPRFGGAVANELASCATWPTPPTGEPGPVVGAGAPPILVVGNTGDPATPLHNAQRVASTLQSAVLLTIDDQGHTAYGRNQCATRFIDSYFIDLDIPAEGTVCD